ncbi:MAG: CBS-domain-containing membrane protein [Myxococcota bacterium]|jgi:CBS-domain-containing membrane protein
MTMSIPAYQVMRRARFQALPHAQISDLFSFMQAHNIRHLPVVDDEDRLLGMLTEQALLQAALSLPTDPETPLLTEAVAADIMVRPSWVAALDEPLEGLIRRMLDERLTCIPVVDSDQRLKGLLTRTDVICALRAEPLPPQYLEAA